MVRSFLITTLLIAFATCSSDSGSRYTSNEGVRFHFKELGEGKPTIIFESGMASTMDTWKAIPDSVSKHTRVFLYDRAGLGKSDIAKTQRTLPNMVDDLKTILEQEDIPPPYIYVAHSMGSYLARYFAVKYPSDVTGVLLTDPSPNKIYDNYSDQEYSEFKRDGAKAFNNSSIGAKAEWENYLDNRKYLPDSIPDDIPLFIISATEWDFFDYHSDMMNENRNSKHLRVEGSHGIHREKPELIIALIKELIQLEIEDRNSSE